MIKNYFKTTLRFLLKNKTFSFINIIGLTAGTLCCLYILLYVKDQYRYDKHHKNANRIYRVTSMLVLPGDKTSLLATTSPPIAPAMKNDFGEVEQFTRVVSTIGSSQHLLQYRGNSFYETDELYVDSTFFQVFTYHFVAGSPDRALQEPNTVVLSKQTAVKLFGKKPAIGETITIDNSYGRNDFKVTGVVDESLGKSHIKGNIFVSISSGGMGEFIRTNTSWAGNNFASEYVKLKPNVSAQSLESKLPAFLNKYGGQQLKDMAMRKVLRLQPITEIHTSPGYTAESSPTVSKIFLYMLLFIAAMIQIIACINFMNLSTARSSKRAREVGVRKVIGAGRTDLVKQFLGESMLLSVISVLLAVPLLWFLIPHLNNLTNANISFALLQQYDVLLILLTVVLVTGLLAGSYPAFYLSAFQILKVIKGNFSNQVAAIGLRKGLVVFQFVLSIVLIVGVLVVNRQINYINNKDLGFDKSQKLIISFQTTDQRQQMNAFKTEVEQLSQVKSSVLSNNYPSQFVYNDLPVFLANGNMQSSKDLQFMLTGEGFIKTMGIHMLYGRDFNTTDSSRVIVNESAVKELGLPADKAVGAHLYSQMGDNNAAPLNFEIIGIMKDFNFNSLHNAVKPFMLAFTNDPNNVSHLIISTEAKDYKTFLNALQVAWKKVLPNSPFEYSFLDEKVQQQYEAEITFSNIINSFTIIAIIISCLGLFGLAAFTAEQRTKEIGIRKVLGASVPGIAAMLSKDFLKLVFISSVIAFPIAWYAMNKWLDNFNYRTDISWWIFIVSGMATLLIALLIVGLQAIKAAIANPVKSLRTE